MKKNLTSTTTLLIAYLAWMSVELASATTTIEPMGKAVAAILGTPKATAKKLNIGDSKIAVGHSDGAVTVYYSKATGKYAFVEKGVFSPDCGHTWAIGIDGASGKVTEVRAIDQDCPKYASPAKSPSFLDQFKGKGPADAATLDSSVTNISKATGTCMLTTDAVKRAITTFQKNKASF